MPEKCWLTERTSPQAIVLWGATRQRPPVVKELASSVTLGQVPAQHDRSLLDEYLALITLDNESPVFKTGAISHVSTRERERERERERGRETMKTFGRCERIT